jgi:hypothetical protein
MSFNEFLQQRFEGVEGTEELRDITRHGLSGGVSGFIYSSELADLYDKYEDEIEQLLDDYGVKLHDLVNSEEFYSIQMLKEQSVWFFVETWADIEYDNRRTTLEELSNENEISLQEYLDSPHGKEHFEIVTC